MTAPSLHSSVQDTRLEGFSFVAHAGIEVLRGTNELNAENCTYSNECHTFLTDGVERSLESELCSRCVDGAPISVYISASAVNLHAPALKVKMRRYVVLKSVSLSLTDSSDQFIPTVYHSASRCSRGPNRDKALCC